ncbi:MAG: bile acid:sodium symporter family protein [Bacteroidetes bacterium]|nr:bile acid:sodium symporter family protein [Bacteroidota bacterium]
MGNTNLLTTIMPIALGIIMLGLGLSLTIADFKRVVKFPKAVFIGLFCQMIVLPFVCFGIAKIFNLGPELAIGLMLLSASPGGPTANLFSHLAKGDVALNITLTALNSILTLVTLPLIVEWSLDLFGKSGEISMPFKKIVEVFLIILIPVSIGMLIHAKAHSFAKMMDKPVKILSALFLVVVIVGAVLKEKENLGNYFEQVGTATLFFNLASMLIGFFVPLFFKIEKKQAIAIGMEIGIHNGTLAIFIALNVLDNSIMSIPPAIYSLLMFFTAAVFGILVNKIGKNKV